MATATRKLPGSFVRIVATSWLTREVPAPQVLRAAAARSAVVQDEVLVPQTILHQEPDRHLLVLQVGSRCVLCCLPAFLFMTKKYIIRN